MKLVDMISMIALTTADPVQIKRKSGPLQYQIWSGGLSKAQLIRTGLWTGHVYIHYAWSIHMDSKRRNHNECEREKRRERDRHHMSSV